MRARTLSALAAPAAVGTLLLCAASAPAQETCQARPGTAALDQYCETVPTAGGARSVNTRGRRLRDVLPAGVVRRFLTRGPTGAAVLELPALASRVDRATGRDARGRSRGGGPLRRAAPGVRPIAATDPSANPLKALRSAVGLGGGEAAWLLWLLAGLALAAGALAWASARAQQARGRHQGGPSR